MEYSAFRARNTTDLSIWVVLRTFLAASFVVLLTLTLLAGCIPDIPTLQDPPPVPSSDSGQSTSTDPYDLTSDTITVDSYESDIFYDAGYEITMAGVRFPLPTTLNELGDDWRFEEDERMYSTFDDYYEGTDRMFQATGTRLYFKDRCMGLVFMENFDISDKRNGKIISIGFDAGNRIDGYAGELEVNGIGLGIPVSQLEELFQGCGKRVTKERSELYDIVVKDYHILYVFYEHEMEELNLSEDYRGCATSLNIGLNFDHEPYGTHLPNR
jgi:hypothetical protein